ncbi:MAG: protein-export chaperone SecB [Proteobacteria bacterium]|nr:protein-export chaperone SecB [Pseudomonadota bacterium]MBS0463329.1 protein-export chaperone SecB [Pseudomonadota bacterium]MBS0463850.1 protein-export chaperone SecB [Pseudomonadota bacterium]
MADEATNGAAGADAAAQGAQFLVHKLYLKNVSYEAPGVPAAFQEQAMPQLSVNLNQKVGRFEADAYEVSLTITVTCTINEKTAYLAEVEQAGIFGLAGFDEANLDMMLGTHCPNILFPYARQALGDLIAHGGFPPFLLQPINFEGVYADQLRRRMEQAQQPAIGNA